MIVRATVLFHHVLSKITLGHDSVVHGAEQPDIVRGPRFTQPPRPDGPYWRGDVA